MVVELIASVAKEIDLFFPEFGMKSALAPERPLVGRYEIGLLFTFAACGQCGQPDCCIARARPGPIECGSCGQFSVSFTEECFFPGFIRGRQYTKYLLQCVPVMAKHCFNAGPNVLLERDAHTYQLAQPHGRVLVFRKCLPRYMAVLGHIFRKHQFRKTGLMARFSMKGLKQSDYRPIGRTGCLQLVRVQDDHAVEGST